MLKYFYVISSTLVIFVMITACEKPKQVLLRKDIDEKCSINIIAESNWEISVPIYLEGCTKSGFTIRSNPFYYVSPDNLNSKYVSEVIAIDKIGDLLIFRKADDARTILALIDISDGFVYPCYGADKWCGSQHYDNKLEQKIMFLKVAMKDESLVLSY